MGSVNYGSQIKSIEINSDAADYVFNQMGVGVVPTGIYRGGILSISDQSVVVSPLVAQILDSNGLFQVRLETTTDVTLGSDETMPYVVMRWVRSETVGNNYIDFTITDDVTLYPNALILGKCVFAGGVLTSLVYYENTGSDLLWQRSTPADPRFSLLVEFDTDLSSRDIYVFPGKVPNISGVNITGSLSVGFQKINVGSSGNLILYVNRSQAPGYVTPTLGTYPSGSAFVKFAELNGVPASGSLSLSSYVDSRHFCW